MNIRITGKAKEIADLVKEIQGQPTVKSVVAAEKIVDDFTQSFAKYHAPGKAVIM